MAQLIKEAVGLRQGRQTLASAHLSPFKISNLACREPTEVWTMPTSEQLMSP